MVVLFDDAQRNAALDAMETAIGPSPIARAYSGSPGAVPASLVAAPTGIVIATGTLPPDFEAAAAGGVKNAAGLWQITGNSNAGAGTGMAYIRLFSSDGTTLRRQYSVGVSVPLTTSSLTAAGGNVLNFASTTGVIVGMRITGAGILPDTYVLQVTGSTVVMSRASVAGVAGGASITHRWDLAVDNASIANTQVLTISAFPVTMGGA